MRNKSELETILEKAKEEDMALGSSHKIDVEESYSFSLRNF